MKREYYNKSEFIDDFISFIRKLKRNNSGNNTELVFKQFNICGETWKFNIYTTRNTVSTESELYTENGIIKYPLTGWDNGCHMSWNISLIDFLNREINKQ